MLIVHRVVLCVRVLSECFMFSQFVTPPPAPRSRGPASASTCKDHVILCVYTIVRRPTYQRSYVDKPIRMRTIVPVAVLYHSVPSYVDQQRIRMPAMDVR